MHIKLSTGSWMILSRYKVPSLLARIRPILLQTSAWIGTGGH